MSASCKQGYGRLAAQSCRCVSLRSSRVDRAELGDYHDSNESTVSSAMLKSVRVSPGEIAVSCSGKTSMCSRNNAVGRHLGLLVQPEGFVQLSHGHLLQIAALVRGLIVRVVVLTVAAQETCAIIQCAPAWTPLGPCNLFNVGMFSNIPFHHSILSIEKNEFRTMMADHHKHCSIPNCFGSHSDCRSAIIVQQKVGLHRQSRSSPVLRHLKNLAARRFSKKPMRGDLRASMAVAGTFSTLLAFTTKLPSTALNSRYLVTFVLTSTCMTPALLIGGHALTSRSLQLHECFKLKTLCRRECWSI